ncbi:MAG: BamA/TamA family outer membrane protein [Planctomycetota bacterium]
MNAQTHDPLQGLNADGSIPGVERPRDIAYPQRWRYVPAGRIVPGSFSERLFVTTFVVPTVFFREDIGVGGGIGVTDIDFRNQRRREFFGAWLSYSSEGQRRLRAVWSRKLAHRALPDGAALFEERSELRVAAGQVRPLTTRFFGLGADSEEGDETSYTDADTSIDIGISHGLPQPGSDLLGSVGLRFTHHDLEGGHVDGVPSTEAVYPNLVEEADDSLELWLRAGLEYDRHDSQHQPYRGWAVRGQVDGLVARNHGDSGVVWRVDATAAYPLASLFHDGGLPGEENPPTDSLNVGAFLTGSDGEVPFNSRPYLGGSHTLRGYIQRRFTDAAAWHASLEWRMWPIPRGAAITERIRIERFGLTLFYDIGSVAGGTNDLRESTIHDSYGVGLRIAFERTAVFRLDYGLSDEGGVFTATFGLPF